MTTDSLHGLHKLFPYDFYVHLQEYVQALYDATLSEFAMTKSDKFRETYPEWTKQIDRSVETRLTIFNQSRQNEEDIFTQEDFEKMKTDNCGYTMWTITYAVPNVNLKEMDLTDENAMREYIGPVIYIQVQLLDENGEPLIGEDISQPDACWDTTDPRLLLCFHKVENDEEGNAHAEDRLLDTEAGRLCASKGENNNDNRTNGTEI